MRDTDANKRRNQIVAQRAAEKAERSTVMSMQHDRELWDEVLSALKKFTTSAIYQGQPGNAVQGVRAQLACRELKLRGTQLQLPLPD